MTRSLITILLLTLSCTLVAATPAQRFAEARGLIEQGELQSALERIETLRHEYPENVDYVFARANILRLLGRTDEALAELDVARNLAPNYEAVWRLQYALLSRQRGRDARRRRLELREEAARRFPAAAWWRTSVDDPQWLLASGIRFDGLSDGLPGWNDQFVELSRDIPTRYRLSAQLARFQRYNRADRSLTLSTDFRLPREWFTGAAVAVADGASSQPGASLSAHAGRPFGDGFVGRIGLGFKAFDDVDVGSLVMTVAKYAGAFRIAYTGTSTRLADSGIFFSHAITANWYQSETRSLGLTISAGSEAELLEDRRVLESTVRGIALSGRVQLTPKLQLQAAFGSTQQGDFYRRQTVGLVVSIQL